MTDKKLNNMSSKPPESETSQPSTSSLKFSLEDLPSYEDPDEDLPPPQEPNNDDELISNILPSYHMFQSTISKNLTLTNENFSVDPPMYEVSPVSSATPSLMSISALQSPIDHSSTSLDQFPFPLSSVGSNEDNEGHTFNEESFQIWENTILANVHKLPNLTKLKDSPTSSLEINITTTEKVCRKGVEPIIIDLSDREFKQGDYIHGYVTILNKSDKPIPFEMVYVVFEGVITILDNKGGVIDANKPLTVSKFLNMLDLFASWSYANIDRLITDNGDPHDWCYGETDPYDNTVLSIDVKRLFQPGVTYKRFFSFKIPEKLLDDICENHSLIRHAEVPPSLGIPRNQFSVSKLFANPETQIRDLTFIDTSISYSVDARIIGRSHDYEYELDKQDKYIIAKESTRPIRVIPFPYQTYVYNRKAIYEESKIYYKAFVDSIRSKIEFGEDLLNTPPTQRLRVLGLTPQSSRDSFNNDSNKLRQLYDIANINNLNHQFKKNHKQFVDDFYQYLLPYKKKSLTGSVKILGVVSLSTPKGIYSVDYIPPLKFRNGNKKYNTEVVIPLELSYVIENTLSKQFSSSSASSSTSITPTLTPTHSHSHSHPHSHSQSSLPQLNSKVQFPEIKSLQVELVTLTIRSKKYPVPFEFTHDLCFKDQEIDSSKKKEIDNFDSIVIKQFHEYLLKIGHLIKSVGNEIIKFETQLYKDIRSLAHLQTKYINLSISDYELISKNSNQTSLGIQKSLKTIPWEFEPPNTSHDHELYSKKFDIKIDLNSCHLKGLDNAGQVGFDYVTLVPSFQTCLMTRLYYFKVVVRLTNGESLVVNVPLSIERDR
ncbi:BUL1-like protein [Scheffersomyces amazonensis]|uniref:BUL1-like protein n=1 Tax=Scheffersomyces amazonensis TaxID=1078765 RepID=UPI00315D8AC9